MESLLYIVTAILLIAGWAAMELLLLRRTVRGTVIGESPCSLPLAGLIATDVRVRLEDGREVLASASGCVRCQAGLAPGSMVALLHRKNGFVITTPWLPSRAGKCGAGE